MPNNNRPLAYSNYLLKLIADTGARNHVEAFMVKRIREHWATRHRITTTTAGTTEKFSRYWIKRFCAELRGYRKWLDYCEVQNIAIPGTVAAIRASDAELAQLELDIPEAQKSRVWAYQQMLSWRNEKGQ